MIDTMLLGLLLCAALVFVYHLGRRSERIDQDKADELRLIDEDRALRSAAVQARVNREQQRREEIAALREMLTSAERDNR